MPDFCPNPNHPCDTYLCQVCLTVHCEMCDKAKSKWMKIPGKQREGNVCPECQKKMEEVTYIEEAEVYSCNNCGAYSSTPQTIAHIATCKRGEAKRWERHYQEGNEQISLFEHCRRESGYQNDAAVRRYMNRHYGHG